MSSAHDLDDDAALAAWREGDRAAGQLLFTRYYQPVARFFINKVGEASPDLIQRTFLACVEGKDKFRGEGSFRSYVFAIAYRQLCGHYRSRHGARVVLEEVSVADLEPSLSGMLVEQEEMQLFLAALRRLPMELQVLLELHYWERCKISEMA
ncbi:MAG: sigma-70 family RNA polymerase sigma factor, partial [Myxococcales bacterium]|nr:sigma-70 family RNA polymerase sigma factor [Myxococcales bacterium]